MIATAFAVSRGAAITEAATKSNIAIGRGGPVLSRAQSTETGAAKRSAITTAIEAAWNHQKAAMHIARVLVEHNAPGPKRDCVSAPLHAALSRQRLTHATLSSTAVSSRATTSNESTSPRKTRTEQLAEIGAPTMSSTRIAKVTADRAFAEGASLAPQWLAERRDFTEAWEHDTFLEAGMKKIPRERNAVDIDLVVEWLESHSELGVVLNCSGTKHRRLFFQSLARKAHLTRLAPSEVLFSCGDESGDEFFVVHHGALRILDEEGVEIAVVKRGEVLGYAALMQMSQAKNRVQRWTVACGAEERASLFALNATVFYEEMDTWGERIRAVARELHAKVDIFKPIGLLDLGRVACFMMKPADFACGDVIASQGAAARRGNSK